MKALHVIILALLLLPLASQQATADETTKSTNAPLFKIGFIVSLTGPLASFGEAIRNGVTLALEDEPSIQRTLEPVFEDSKYDSKTSVSNFQKLRSVDRVNALYVFGGPMSDTLSPLAEHAKIPMFSTEYDTRYTRGKEYVMRFCNNAEDYAKVLLDELRKRGYKRYAIIKVENQYHNTLSEAFLKGLTATEHGDIIENVLPGEKDFRTILPKIQAGTFDALGIYLSPGMQNAFFKQMQSLHLRPVLFGTDTFESREENEGVQDTVAGTIFANSAVQEEFISRYRKRFNSTTQIVHAALAYEFVRLTGDLFKNDSVSVSANEFVHRYATSAPRESVCGRYSYRNSPETGQYFSFPIAIRSIENGEAKIKSVTPAP